MAQSPPVATYQDVLDAPENMVAELIDGELFLQPRPAQPHTEAASVLGGLLVAAFRLGVTGPGGWRIQYEPELHLGPQVLVPDLAGWRIADADVDLHAAYVECPPVFVCEVLSPSTRRLDRHRKLPIYARFGVAWAWLLDPIECTLEVFERRDDGWRPVAAHEGSGTVRVPPFDAIDLPLAELWPSGGAP